MDPILNPFAPGAGSRPPALAGRDELLRKSEIALGRVKIGRHARSMMMLGLRGVGKTVLLIKISEIAEEAGYTTALIEAPEERGLAALMVPKLRGVLYKLSGVEKARVLANRALGTLRSFARTFKVSYGELEIGIDPEPGMAASGDLENDFTELLVAIAEAARAAEKPVAVFIDEVQYLKNEDLAALIVALHRIGQKGLPLILFGAGLPQLAALSGEVKSYAERLFEYREVGPLDEAASVSAIHDPVLEAGAEISPEASLLISRKTQGYPYFIQEWGSHTWNLAQQSPISVGDVEAASKDTQEALDASFFGVRFDRLTPREQEYLRAMAELGPGPHRSGDVADQLGIKVTSAGPLRTGLIRKGMIWSPAHGDTAFTVPMFEEYMKRTMPQWPQWTIGIGVPQYRCRDISQSLIRYSILRVPQPFSSMCLVISFTPSSLGSLSNWFEFI